MAKIELGKEFNEYLEKLEQLEKKDTVPLIKQSLFDGAGVVADAIHDEIERFPGTNSPKKGPTKKEKQALLDGLGISPMEFKGDDVSVKIGFAGYGVNKTKKYPKGVPIPMLARSIIRGTSFRPSDDFVARAIRKSRKESINQMDETLNKLLEKELK